MPISVARTDGGRRFCSGRVVPRRVAEKGSRVYVVCCIHGWSALLWAHSKGGGSTKAVEYRTVSGRVIYYRENVINESFFDQNEGRACSRRALMFVDTGVQPY